MNADTEKAMMRARAGEMPIDCAADLAALQREERLARACRLQVRRPSSGHERSSTIRRGRGTTLSLPKSHGPRPAAGPACPAAPRSPPPTHENFTITASKKNAKARVAMAIQMPSSRRSGQREQRADDRRDDRADERGDEHGRVEAIDELEHGERADGGEGALAQGDLAGRCRSSRVIDRNTIARIDGLRREEDPRPCRPW